MDQLNENRYYFKLWKQMIKRFREYDQWCELNNGRIEEEERISIENDEKAGYRNLNWNYSDCDHDI